ncbi:hypothetical protein [Pseudochryseolinea flava]|uniref:hypothetical protein n=1 Tax=Pseudochryseolinea flava TaxID=2059302 RepID=UPI001057A43F|nr:hypothetical protein [Pseudochryseolinea flava]
MKAALPKRFSAIIALAFCLVCPQVFGQQDNSIPLDHFYVDRQGPSFFRKVLSKVTFGLSTGYGLTTFKHSLDGYGIQQNPGERPIIFPIGDAASTSGYSNWFNRVDSAVINILPTSFRASSDTADIGFRNKAFNIPLKATLHVEFLDRYRIGGGYSFEYVNLRSFVPTKYDESINLFKPDVPSFFLKKYFFMLGASVYRYYEYLLVVDANIGGYSLGKKFDKEVINKGVYFNLGVAVEREMSEYFRVFVRPSYEFKNFKTSIEGADAIKHKFNAFYVNVGVTYRIPELRRCFLKTCNIQINHAHGNREYRSRVHPIHKKQNPHYGENHPTLIKYKGRNKKKLNPY